MLCCICKEKKATVHLTQIVGDSVQKLDMCEECAREKGLDDPTEFALADQVLGLGAAQALEQAASGGEVKCPGCGYTQSDFKKSGRLGCARCYETFYAGLEGLLRSMHADIRHAGKTPRSAAAPSPAATDQHKQLAQQLEQAIAREDYEKAAQLRDEIRALKAREAARLGGKETA